ncbi:hypothetical protein Hanom_Chr15g01369451 [Helianthus anomalus]
MCMIFYLYSHGFLLFLTFYLVFGSFTHLYFVALYWSLPIWFVCEFPAATRDGKYLFLIITIQIVMCSS